MNILHLNKLSLNTLSLNIVGEYMSGKKLPEILEDIWEEYIASGVDILSIKNTKENSISSLLVSGGCSQSATPTPVAPVSIQCNKGNIYYEVSSKNLLEVNDENIVVGKYINNNGEIATSAANCYFQRFIYVKPSTTYTLSTNRKLNYANFMEYDADGVFIKRTLYGSSSVPTGTSVSHTMGDTTAFVIVGSNVDSSAFPTITKDNVKSIDWMFNEGSTVLPYEEYKAIISYSGSDSIYIYGKNLSLGELIDKGYASTGAVSTSTTFCGNLYKIPVSAGQKYTISWGDLPDGMSGVFINTWNTDGSWRARQAISATDSLTYTIPEGVGEVNFTLYKTGGITIGPDTWMQVEYGDTATEYTPAVEPVSVLNTNALLNVGDYVDTVELVKGEINKKVGVKVLNGTENISTSNSVFTIGITDKLRSKTSLHCTHFGYSTSTSSAVADMKIISFSSQNVGFRHDACTDIESFRQFLQREYAKGTPVMVVYPLEREYTITTGKQVILNPKGDLTVIRDAEIDNLSMEVTCMVKGEKPEDNKSITFNAYVCIGDSMGGGTDWYENQTFTATEGITWKEYVDTEDYTAHPFFYYPDSGVWINDGAMWLPQEFRITLDGNPISENDKIVANAQYDFEGRM